MVKSKAVLVLADGTTYRGFSFGALGTAIGEVVFNTGMTGYQEVLTDPSYTGQIVTFTCPELGNTGVNHEDQESDRPQVKGVIARNVTFTPSSWRSEQSLPDYLKANQIIAIGGVDTRALTRKLRSAGAMNGAISTEILETEALLEQIRSLPPMEGLNLAQAVSTTKIYEWQEPTLPAWQYGNPQPGRFVVVAIDFGIKRNILRRLVSYGCRVIVVPADTPVEVILSYNPDGIFLSNGPGDPAAVEVGIKTAKSLLESQKPLFGICLGHQILGLALGGSTYKLKFGHRGLNHPCGLEETVEITSQNHGFALKGDSFDPQDTQITRLNLNDGTVAALAHTKLPIFSVQYHPEASPGPHDADYLFAQFIELMAQNRRQTT
ncbi:MAG: carbamoyl phosphate synthase small subunit [Cyanobacteria bacterium M5B4]|nr:MAG: carbamoyl phosphate synthase small subunit [Cyanobacteria bacterium M5B4]